MKVYGIGFLALCVLFVHLGKQCIETARLQVLLDLPVPELRVILRNPRHQISYVSGREPRDGRFDFLDAHAS